MIFSLQIDEHLEQFGETAASEQQVIRELLAQVAVAIGSLQVATEAAPAPLVLNRLDGSGSGIAIVVGQFFFGDSSHAVAEQQARQAAQAEADRTAKEAVKPKGKAA